MIINDIEYFGLTSDEVKSRQEKGQINIQDKKISKSYQQIFLDNTITFFNMINIVLLALVLFVGSLKNGLFFFIIIINTFIGIIQEIRAKRTLDKLSLLTESHVEVVRDNVLQEISIEELVLDDYMILSTGWQIPADAIIINGSLEVNESLLTGEADTLLKQVDDQLYSGSFVTAGYALCQVIHVGKDNYMNQITSQAKEFKKHVSRLSQSLDFILKKVSIIIVPLGLLLFLKQYYIAGLSQHHAILNTVAAVLGMIPEGLVLLTSVALTLSVIRLSKQQTLVQELFCIETLARVDVLCLDKTGTITQGKMKVETVIPIHDDVNEIIGNMLFTLNDQNVTSKALQEYFDIKNSFQPHFVVPFSSARKYSAVSFVNQGTYFLGSLQNILDDPSQELIHTCNAYAKEGYRILLLAHSKEVIDEEVVPKDCKPVAIILIADIIRPDAKETLAYFDQQGVTLKVISGDDPITVSAVAKKAGLKNAEKYVDASTLISDEDIQNAVLNYTVFGRVSPKQKKQMVIALKNAGSTVAMTGDGVNDVLAFKEANCSIAMASGSDVAKHAANLILLDNNFAAMPHIVNEGRRVINNITTAASMFLIKTIFSILLSISTIILGQVYPFAPIHLTIINACAVGIPTFFLTYEANFKIVKDDFIEQVILLAFPTAFTISICTTLIMNVGIFLHQPTSMLTTMCVLITGIFYLNALSKAYHPLTLYRKIVIYSMDIIFIGALIIGQSILDLTSINFNGVLVLIGLVTFYDAMFQISKALYLTIRNKWKRKQVFKLK